MSVINDTKVYQPTGSREGTCLAESPSAPGVSSESRTKSLTEELSSTLREAHRIFV